MFSRLFGKSRPKTINFGNTTSKLVEVAPNINPADALKRLELPPFNAAIIIHSGAAGMSDEYLKKLAKLFDEGLAPYAEKNKILILDGGTDAGCARLIGKARQKIKGTFSLVGVTIRDGISYPGGLPQDENHWPLEKNHSHFIIVKAKDFGAESPLLVGLAQVWNVPKLAMIVNGGAIVEKEAEMHAKLGTPILSFKGSGRFADTLTGAFAIPNSEIRSKYPTNAVVESFDTEKSSPTDLNQLLDWMLFQKIPHAN